MKLKIELGDSQKKVRNILKDFVQNVNIEVQLRRRVLVILATVI